MRMIRTMIAAAVALSLCACGTTGFLSGAPPAPLARTQIDDNAVNFALESFDAALYLVDAAVDSGKIKPGSPQALRLATLIRKVMRFLGAAEAAQRAGQANSYADAMKAAREALAEFRAAISTTGPTASAIGAAGGPASFRWLVRSAHGLSASAQVGRNHIARRLAGVMA